MMNRLMMSLLLIFGGFLVSSGQVDSLIKATLIKEGYSERHASYWVMVSKYETANYNSILCKYHNNLWGMSYFKNGKRQTEGTYRVYHKGKPTRFAGYKTKEAAVKEIILYLKTAEYPKDFKTLKGLITFMKRKGYFEEPFDFYYNAISKFK